MPPKNTPHILIVDDEPAICEYLEQFLNRQEYTTVTAGSGHEAIQALKNSHFDLVFLDISLPDLSGYDVMDQIKAYSPDSLIIMMTGYASIETAVKALRQGAYDYLRKPFEMEELLKTIHNAVAHQRLETAHRKSEQALRESEERFRDLVENSLIGISIIQNNQIVYQNSEQRKLFGRLPASFMIDDRSFVYPDDVPKVENALKNVLEGTAPSVEIDFRFNPSGKSGDKIDLKWVQCRASTFTYQGQPAILVNMMDITRLKELEHLVMIKYKMDSLGRVATGIAHEIRNPLTGINSYLFTLQDLCAGDRIAPENVPMIQRISDQIQVASNRIEAVIKRVLDFSKPTAPKMLLVDINVPIREAIDLSAVALRKNEIKLEQGLTDDLPGCYGDVHMLEQVILNLINNAANAMRHHVEAKKIGIRSYAEGQSVCIHISDSGPGVPAELREKIFDPFFTTSSDGSGIGLSIAQRIIADHNGNISIGTSQWQGADFKIELPVEKRMLPR